MLAVSVNKWSFRQRWLEYVQTMYLYVLFLMALLQPSSAIWVNYNSSEYFIDYRTFGNFAVAAESCRDKGSVLAVVNSIDVLEFISSNIRNLTAAPFSFFVEQDGRGAGDMESDACLVLGLQNASGIFQLRNSTCQEPSRSICQRNVTSTANVVITSTTEYSASTRGEQHTSSQISPTATTPIAAVAVVTGTTSVIITTKREVTSETASNSTNNGATSMATSTKPPGGIKPELLIGISVAGALVGTLLLMIGCFLLWRIGRGRNIRKVITSSHVKQGNSNPQFENDSEIGRTGPGPSHDSPGGKATSKVKFGPGNRISMVEDEPDDKIVSGEVERCSTYDDFVAQRRASSPTVTSDGQNSKKHESGIRNSASMSKLDLVGPENVSEPKTPSSDFDSLKNPTKPDQAKIKSILKPSAQKTGTKNENEKPAGDPRPTTNSETAIKRPTKLNVKDSAQKAASDQQDRTSKRWSLHDSAFAKACRRVSQGIRKSLEISFSDDLDSESTYLEMSVKLSSSPKADMLPGTEDSIYTDMSLSLDRRKLSQTAPSFQNLKKNEPSTRVETRDPGPQKDFRIPGIVPGKAAKSNPWADDDDKDDYVQMSSGPSPASNDETADSIYTPMTGSMRGFPSAAKQAMTSTTRSLSRSQTQRSTLGAQQASWVDQSDRRKFQTWNNRAKFAADDEAWHNRSGRLIRPSIRNGFESQGRRGNDDDDDYVNL